MVDLICSPVQLGQHEVPGSVQPLVVLQELLQHVLEGLAVRTPGDIYDQEHVGPGVHDQLLELQVHHRHDLTLTLICSVLSIRNHICFPLLFCCLLQFLPPSGLQATHAVKWREVWEKYIRMLSSGWVSA